MPPRRTSALGSASLLLSLAFACVVPLTARACEAAEALPEDEADAVIESLLERQRALARVEAVVETRKEGGAFKRERVSRGRLRAAKPDRVLFESFPEDSAQPDPEGRAGFVLVDGRFLWEAQPQAEGRPQLVERRVLESEEGEASPLGDLAAFLLGVEISDAGGLRQEFAVAVTPAPAPGGEPGWHIRLAPQDAAAERSIELWVARDAALPWKTRTTATTVVYRPGVPAADRPVRTSVETTELRDVRTDRTGLAPFPPETFLVPLRPDMTVVDERGDEIPPEVLRADRARMRARLTGDAMHAPDGAAGGGDAWE